MQLQSKKLFLAIFIILYCVQPYDCQLLKRWPKLFYTYRQENKTFFRVINDPEQVKPNIPTKDNLFEWVNPKSYVKFRLWTRKNPHLAHEIRYNDIESLQTSNFDAKKTTKVIIHGFWDGASEVRIGQWIIFMRDSFLKLADVNVIVVDYAYQALATVYVTSRPLTIGKRVGEMIRFLETKGGASLDTFHLIGWSWGAHICGFAGKHLNGQIQRISGLDPAGPTFRFVEEDGRLDSSDAKFVDVYHVNGGGSVLWGGYYGHSGVLGHVDIYYNGGAKQPGCPRERSLVYETLWCNHGRAPAYFTESILSPLAFPSCKCPSLDEYLIGKCQCSEKDVIYAGEHIPITTRGVYQVITRSNSPFGLGPQMQISTESNDLRIVLQNTTISETLNINPYNISIYPNSNDILQFALKASNTIKV